MKKLCSLITFFLCAHLHTATPVIPQDTLAYFEKEIFTAAITNKKLSEPQLINLTHATLTTCISILTDAPEARNLFSLVAQEFQQSSGTLTFDLNLTSHSLCNLILDFPKPLHELYTLIKLVQFSKDLTAKAPSSHDNANKLVVKIVDAMKPFIEEEKTRKLFFIFWSTAGIIVTTSCARYFSQQAQAHNQEVSAREQEQRRKIENLEQANTRISELENTLATNNAQTFQSVNSHVAEQLTTLRTQESTARQALTETWGATQQQHYQELQRLQQSLETTQQSIASLASSSGTTHQNLRSLTNSVIALDHTAALNLQRVNAQAEACIRAMNQDLHNTQERLQEVQTNFDALTTELLSSITSHSTHLAHTTQLPSLPASQLPGLLAGAATVASLLAPGTGNAHNPARDQLHALQVALMNEEMPAAV